MPANRDRDMSNGIEGKVAVITGASLRALSEGLRQEVKPYNIRTTVIRRARSRRSCPTA
jgi:hypothetical protein